MTRTAAVEQNNSYLVSFTRLVCSMVSATEISSVSALASDKPVKTKTQN
jgi:hypothetical protein